MGISPAYVKGFKQGNHKTHENGFRTIWNLTVFFMASCQIHIEAYTVLAPNDLAGPSALFHRI